jgi:putative redox protein
MATPSASTDSITTELVWAGDLKFGATTGSSAIVLDGDSTAGPSPMQLLGEALAGCMAIDVVMILQKGRHPLTGLRVSFSGNRAAEPPKRFISARLTFHVTGNVPAAAVQRAIDLSQQTYCSVWHSLRPDVALTTAYDIHA